MLICTLHRVKISIHTKGHLFALTEKADKWAGIWVFILQEGQQFSPVTSNIFWLLWLCYPANTSRIWEFCHHIFHTAWLIMPSNILHESTKERERETHTRVTDVLPLGVQKEHTCINTHTHSNTKWNVYNQHTLNPRQWANQITLLTHFLIKNLYTHGRGDSQ